MKIRKIFSVLIAGLFGLMGICAAAAGIYLALNNRSASPVLLQAPESARQQVETMMEAVCAGDYAAAGNAMYGTPDLGVDRDAADPVGDLVWDAFVESLSYELTGECFATDSGIAQNVVISCLDIDSVTSQLRDSSQALLAQRVEEAAELSEIYDENNEYREEFVMEVVYAAAQQILEANTQFVRKDVTLNLVYENGQWWVMPEEALLEAVSGGVLK